MAVLCDKKEVSINGCSLWDSHREKKDIGLKKKARSRCNECSHTVWKSLWFFHKSALFMVLSPSLGLAYHCCISKHTMGGWVNEFLNNCPYSFPSVAQGHLGRHRCSINKQLSRATKTTQSSWQEQLPPSVRSSLPSRHWRQLVAIPWAPCGGKPALPSTYQ